MNFRCLTALAFVVSLLLSSGYAENPCAQAAGTVFGNKQIPIQKLPGLPSLHVSEDNPPPAETNAMGQRLYYDTNSSQNPENLVAYLASPTGEVRPGIGAPD